ncbi:hypothetical protein JUJ52_02495 [Virgibacillus sp. AGTR]|uniref:hypothetical protein n=1 Tax=Virgibacillus sp. AGTR TaxID=2812055 RepID=UPI001D163DF6|nr:hypothetical protein [Virgibacillus sp. AGTR]MCC2248828.1 hypothetical protein [Virgibacillus sp. AGTR]
MNVWLVIDMAESTGSQIVKGIFDSEQKAKLFIADYVLEECGSGDDIELIKKKVEVTKE